jgi:hypothetical protein
MDFPVPDLLPVPEGLDPLDIEDAALSLYQALADANRLNEENEARTCSLTEEQARASQALIAGLAAERFEFSRLVRRIARELERLGASDSLRVLELHERAWDQRLSRAHIEVLDVTGFPLTNELLANVEVEAAVPDATVAHSEIRETLTPLVSLNGRPIGTAKVVTSVAAQSEEELK